MQPADVPTVVTAAAAVAVAVVAAAAHPRGCLPRPIRNWSAPSDRRQKIGRPYIPSIRTAIATIEVEKTTGRDRSARCSAVSPAATTTATCNLAVCIPSTIARMQIPAADGCYPSVAAWTETPLAPAVAIESLVAVAAVGRSQHYSERATASVPSSSRPTEERAIAAALPLS